MLKDMTTDGNSSSGSNGIEVALLEKRLEGLRDTQESVQGLSLWCQANKKHSTPIIDTWLRVLRRSPVEKRLTMFYLANDVVQHAKKKGDTTVVNQWAVATQKATPHVRSPSSVSTAIIRIFKIWEERGIYSKDTVADLISLVSKQNPTGKELPPESKKKPEIYTASDEKVKEFQSATLISMIKQAFKLKSHLGVTFRTKQYVNMNMEQLIASIKDRQHGMSVVENMSELLDACRVSENKLVHEVDERRRIVEAAEVAIVFYENVRAEALIVSNAYKSFTERVIKTKNKVDEMIRAFAEMEGSPIPSPDRLSPFDEVKVMLPSLAELEARQAQVNSMFQNQSSTSQQPLNSDGKTNSMMQGGMLASGTAYDLMSAAQWPTYAMQFQMMQMAYSQALQADAKAQTQNQIQAASPTGAVPPLPPDSKGGGQETPKHQPPLPSPAPQPPSTPSTEGNPPVPYDPANIHQYSTPTPSSASSQEYAGSTSIDYGHGVGMEESEYPEDLEGNPYVGYDESADQELAEEYMDHEPQQHFTPTTTPPNPTGRYHPYNSTPRSRGRGVRRVSGDLRSRFPSSLPFRNSAPIPFNPRNPNTTPILRRGGPRPRFSPYTPRGGRLAHNTTSNLLRLAQYQVEPSTAHQGPSSQNEEQPYTYYPTKDYLHGSIEDSAEELNGDEPNNFQSFTTAKPLLQTARGRGSPLAGMPRGPRGIFKPRGRGQSPGGFRSIARGRPPRRGNYYIL